LFGELHILPTTYIFITHLIVSIDFFFLVANACDKRKIQCKTHAKDFCGKNAPKSPDSEEKNNSQITTFREWVRASCQNIAGFFKKKFYFHL
jgi:hypothetical protein